MANKPTRRTNAISVDRIGDDEICIVQDGTGSDDTAVCFPVVQAEQIIGWISEIAAKIKEQPKVEKNE